MEEQILKRYKELNSAVKVAEELGLTHKKVRQILSRNNIKFYNTNSGNNKYSKNEKFFSEPTTLNSYWAGFIGADGHISQDNAVIVTLKESESYHLERLRENVEFTGNIKHYNSNTTYVKAYDYCRLSLYSKQMCVDLETNWCIVPNKTKIIEFPKNLIDKHIFSYIVGYIDGDGSFNFSNGKLHSLNVWGHRYFLESMRKFFSKFLNEPEEAFKIYADRTIFRLSISRKNLLIKFKDKFLELKELPYLERKWNRLLEADLSKGRI